MCGMTSLSCSKASFNECIRILSRSLLSSRRRFLSLALMQDFRRRACCVLPPEPPPLLALPPCFLRFLLVASSLLDSDNNNSSLCFETISSTSTSSSSSCVHCAVISSDFILWLRPKGWWWARWARSGEVQEGRGETYAPLDWDGTTNSFTICGVELYPWIVFTTHYYPNYVIHKQNLCPTDRYFH